MDFVQLHRIFLGPLVTDEHSRLYENFPQYRGLSKVAPTRSEFEATFIVALTQALWAKDGGMNESFVLTPASLTSWVNTETITLVRKMFAHVKGMEGTPETRRRVAEKLGAGVKHLMVGSRVHQMEEPARWVSVGFQVTDPIPDWVKSSLLV